MNGFSKDADAEGSLFGCNLGEIGVVERVTVELCLNGLIKIRVRFKKDGYSQKLEEF